MDEELHDLIHELANAKMEYQRVLDLIHELREKENQILTKLIIYMEERDEKS